ncbi:zinc finger BED domain-containing protein 5 [Nephila pilipes]|uniref:Zinc finger BED domain-containing protein 5 n=1 Tax=Nephila pilipes TaxID=299642 RepID=A0A8X6MY79_NEPPI|nr:zinc finger BED domain-containing protein 5 [Nephila pilipes]
MSNFCENELIKSSKTSEHEFTIRFDETIDITGLSILLAIVRYILGTDAQEDMLICKSLPTRTTAGEVFNFVNSYFKKHDISWDMCHQVCTDAWKTERRSCTHKTKLNPHKRSTHCGIHRQALAVKKMTEVFT